MKIKDILSPSFKDYQKAIEPMIAVGWDSDLCQKVVSNGWLSEEQGLIRKQVHPVTGVTWVELLDNSIPF